LVEYFGPKSINESIDAFLSNEARTSDLYRPVTHIRRQDFVKITSQGRHAPYPYQHNRFWPIRPKVANGVTQYT
jgi:hypothetical protein